MILFEKIKDKINNLKNKNNLPNPVNDKLLKREQNKNSDEGIVYGSSNNLSKNFSYSEMIYSATANKYKIDNTPDNESLANLKKLCETILQPIRDKYGYPIKITSGYRGPKLNQKVGGAKNSDHMFGAAADFKATHGTNKELFDLVMKMIKNKEIKCRQLIWEYGTKSNPNWLHISINHSKNKQKNNQVLYIFD